MEQKIWKAVWPTKANSHMPRREDPVSPSEDWVVGGGGVKGSKRLRWACLP